MQKQTLYFNEPAFNQTVNDANQSIDKFQNLLDAFNKLELFQLKNINDLIDLSLNGEEYIKRKIAEQIEPKMVGAFRMKKSVLVESLDLPNFNYINELSKDCRGLQAHMRYCEIKQNKVELSSIKLAELKQDLSTLTDNTKQIEVLKLHKEAAEALNKLKIVIEEEFEIKLDQDINLKHWFCFEDTITSNSYLYKVTRKAK